MDILYAYDFMNVNTLCKIFYLCYILFTIVNPLDWIYSLSSWNMRLPGKLASFPNPSKTSHESGNSIGSLFALRTLEKLAHQGVTLPSYSQHSFPLSWVSFHRWQYLPFPGNIYVVRVRYISDLSEIRYFLVDRLSITFSTLDSIS